VSKRNLRTTGYSVRSETIKNKHYPATLRKDNSVALSYTTALQESRTIPPTEIMRLAYTCPTILLCGLALGWPFSDKATNKDLDESLKAMLVIQWYLLHIIYQADASFVSQD
jgi:hypothetical protein